MLASQQNVSVPHTLLEVHDTVDRGKCGAAVLEVNMITLSFYFVDWFCVGTVRDPVAGGVPGLDQQGEAHTQPPLLTGDILRTNR